MRTTSAPTDPHLARRQRARATGQRVRDIARERKVYLAERASVAREREEELAANVLFLASLAEDKVRARNEAGHRGMRVTEGIAAAQDCQHGGGGLVLTPVLLRRMRRYHLCTACGWALEHGQPVRMDSGLVIAPTGGHLVLVFEPCGCITQDGQPVRPCTEHR